ncbi:MAG TPA: RES family NAD+ phosphorylase [Rubrivivax sp.]|nr:RES family NAD+ phosphorylase [Rubrivivax sp.]HPO19566.1 RES family NAD+ phosphorylase [Rubrivivax sp.]
MILWRISNHAGLSGAGGLLHAGRWHHRGRPVVYLAESPAGALVEALVHVQAASAAELPATYQLLEVELPDSAASSELAAALPQDWRERTDLTRTLGSDWLAGASGLLLRVPSAVVARSFNRLFNPAHPQAAACKVLSVARHPFDGRLPRRRR